MSRAARQRLTRTGPWYFIVKKSVLVALSLGAFASTAFAADVAIKGSLSETLDGSNNYFLLNSPSGTTFRSLSAVNLDVLARTPDTRLLLNTNLSYYNYFGAGAADTSPTAGVPLGTSFQLDHTTELDRYNFTMSWHRAPVATTQLAESGVVTTQGFLDTFRTSGSITHDVSRTDSLLWSVQAIKTTFTGSTQTPYVDLSSTGGWIHQFDPRNTLTTTVTLDWFNQDDTANSQRVFWQIMTSLRSQLSSRLTFIGSAGALSSNSYQRNPQPIISPTSFQQGGVTEGVLASAGFTYQLLKSTTVSLTAAQSIVPTTLGPLQKISTVGSTLNYTVNSWSNLSFSAQFAHISDNAFIGGASDLFSAQVSYGYRLARDWRTNVSYTYRVRDDVTGMASSSTILASLTYDFSLMGNPTAFDQAEQERAMRRAQRAVGEAFPNFQ